MRRRRCLPAGPADTSDVRRRGRPDGGLLKRLLLVVGAVLAALALVAGHLNRNLLDGPTFAENVDELRQDDDVAAQVGREISVRVVQTRPDLIALRPLLAVVASEVVQSDALSGPTQAAARQAHAALTDPDADTVVLRLADTAAVVAAAVSVLAPERAPVAQDVAVTLAEIGGQGFASVTLDVARWLGWLAWLLPVLALAALVGAVLLSKDRWSGVAHAGLALVAAAAGLAVALAIGGLVVRGADEGSLHGAVAEAAWRVFVRPMWGPVALLAVAGVVIAVAAGAAVPGWLPATMQRVQHALTRRPSSPGAAVARAVVLAMLGLLLLLDPVDTLTALATVAGVTLLLYAVVQVAETAARARADREADAGAGADTAADGDDGTGSGPAHRRRWGAVAVVAAVVVVLAFGVAWTGRPGGDVAAAPVAADGACNGHVELCDRPYDEVAYAAAHNAMSVARQPGWFIPEQLDPIPEQLDQGVRALLIDVWSGRPAGTVVRTAEGSRPEAEAVVTEELGPEVLAAARRLADSVAGVPQGPEARYLCHGLCEIGATPFVPTLESIRSWLATHPGEVVTLFIEDHVPASLIASDIEAAGLLPYVATPPAPGDPWPTLQQMVSSGQRLVVMVEDGDGGEAAPWLVNGFTLTQDTPYSFASVDELSCEANRGPADAPLFLVNHWLTRFAELVSSAQLLNARDVLEPRARQCRAERGQIPNFVAVDYVVFGDLFAVVDELNGVG